MSSKHIPVITWTTESFVNKNSETNYDKQMQCLTTECNTTANMWAGFVRWRPANYQNIPSVDQIMMIMLLYLLQL